MLTAGTFAGIAPDEDFDNFTFECRGSDCALWVPQQAGAIGEAASATRWDGPLPEGGGGTGTPTGRGWCSNNLRREPYPDPAKDGGQS